MSSFTTPLVVEKIGERLWKTAREFSYYTEDDKEVITVPIGAITDFGSIPRLLWIVLPPDGKYTQACVLHDYLCRKKSHSPTRTSQIFYEALLVLKVNKNLAYLMYKSVLWFGPRWKKVS